MYSYVLEDMYKLELNVLAHVDVVAQLLMLVWSDFDLTNGGKDYVKSHRHNGVVSILVVDNYFLLEEDKNMLNC